MKIAKPKVKEKLISQTDVQQEPVRKTEFVEVDNLSLIFQPQSQDPKGASEQPLVPDLDFGHMVKDFLPQQGHVWKADDMGAKPLDGLPATGFLTKAIGLNLEKSGPISQRDILKKF